MLILMVIVSVALPWYGRRYLDAKWQLFVSRAIAAVISVTVAAWSIYRLAIGAFDWSADLPLQLCYLIALLLVFLMWNPSLAKHELFYYLVLAGTLQGAITPNVEEVYPLYNFLKYWIVHCGLVVYMVYVCVVHRLYPSFRGIFRAYFWINAYAVLMLGFNLIAGTNYFYVMEKPPIPTLLDYLGPWPWYLLSGQLVALVLFWLSWLPMARMSRVSPS